MVASAPVALLASTASLLLNAGRTAAEGPLWSVGLFQGVRLRSGGVDLETGAEVARVVAKGTEVYVQGSRTTGGEYAGAAGLRVRF